MRSPPVQRRSEIVGAIGLEKGMVVADIGAGTGLLTTGIAKRVGPRGTVFARPGALLVLVDMKRPEGQSSPAVLRHVRADKPTVIAEVDRVGFVFESEIDLLRENYYLRFRRP